MAKDPEERSRHEGQREEGIEGLKQGESEVLSDLERPICPRCGWRNTRLSHTRGTLDSVLRVFSLWAFRCRSCGNRFRAFRRPSVG
jgi:hypothetical protein